MLKKKIALPTPFSYEKKRVMGLTNLSTDEGKE